jgi:class 3 adenylate cyclase
MGDHEMKTEKEISSVEIINKTSISRATLNNYIKMGILPRPLVRRPEDNTVSQARQMGYFPFSVMGTLGRVKQYKQEGRRMVEVCKLLADTPIPSSAENEISSTNDAGKILFSTNVSDYGNESEELFSFEETHAGQLSANTELKRDIRITLKQGAVNLLYFSILVAKIQGSTKMRAELPPDVYITLIRQILKSVTLICKQRFGVYGKYPENGVVFYFLKDCDSSYLMNAVVCALELRQMMKKISHEWKMKNEYFDEIFLNIGLSEGHEYLGTIPATAAAAAEYISLGDSINAARRLSDLASSGAIWATKNLLNLLEEKDRKQIRYGIYRRSQNREVWVEKIFSRVMDLIPQDDPRNNKYMDIRSLPVTEIQALR